MRPLPREEATPPVTNTCLGIPELTAMECQSITHPAQMGTRHVLVFSAKQFSGVLEGNLRVRVAREHPSQLAFPLLLA